MGIFYVEKEGAKKYKGYPIGKFRCEFNDNRNELNIYLCNFKDKSGKEFGYKNDTIAYMRVTFLSAEDESIMRYDSFQGIRIYINDFYVQSKDDWGYGFGKLIWLVLLDDGINWYRNRVNINQYSNVMLYGLLSKSDFIRGYWEVSFPFYIEIADRILIDFRHYSSSNTIFGYNINPNKYPIDLFHCYDSGSNEDEKIFKSLGKKQYCQYLISKLNSLKENSYILIQFFV